MDESEVRRELEFIKSNIFSLYEWVCGLEDNVIRIKYVLKKMKDNVDIK